VLNNNFKPDGEFIGLILKDAITALEEKEEILSSLARNKNVSGYVIK
jgi:hypothetical protein